MKKLWIWVLCLLLAGCGSSGSGYSPSYQVNTPQAQPELDYNAVNSALSEVIAQYAPQGEGDFAACRIVFQSGDAALAQSMGADRVITGPDDTYILQYTTPEAAMQAQSRLLATDGVAYAEPDVLYCAEAFYSWGTTDMGTDTFSTEFATAQERIPVIAVVDSGVNSHSAIGTLLPGWDFIENDGQPQDDYGHGTAVAGVVSDVMGDMNHKILPVRVLDHKGDGYSTQLALGIRYAADQGADILNLSLSGGHTSSVDAAVEYAISKGCAVVVAAGNQAGNVSSRCPAHMSGAMTVSAVDSNYSLYFKSNTGSAVDICAPGVDITCAHRQGGMATHSGTSLAAPHISGVLGLILASGTADNPYDAQSVLLHCCIDLGDPGKDPRFGQGYPDMGKVMEVYRQKQQAQDYWILYWNPDDPQLVGYVFFAQDGTYRIEDPASGNVSTGTYWGLGDSSLTLYEDTPTYFMGKDFFDNTGTCYETQSTYHTDAGDGTYQLVHASGIHPYTDTAAN